MNTPELNIKDVDRLTKQLDGDDYKRSMRYAQDLLGGLKKMESYDQGVTVFGSHSTRKSDQYYKQARKLGQILAKNDHSVITGGSGGIMEAANRGAFEGGGTSIGLNIKLPTEQSVNPFVTDSFEFHYFFARKVILVASAKAWVFFPGGFGTLDEVSEVLTLIQTGKVPPAPVILFGSDFWSKFDDFCYKTMQKSFKTIRPNDRRLYTITDDIDIVIGMVNSISTRKVHGVIQNML